MSENQTEPRPVNVLVIPDDRMGSVLEALKTVRDLTVFGGTNCHVTAGDAGKPYDYECDDKETISST